MDAIIRLQFVDDSIQFKYLSRNHYVNHYRIGWVSVLIPRAMSPYRTLPRTVHTEASFPTPSPTSPSTNTGIPKGTQVAKPEVLYLTPKNNSQL